MELRPVEPSAVARVLRLGGELLLTLASRLRAAVFHPVASPQPEPPASERGRPFPSDGSKVKTSVATSVSRSWLLTNEATRCRVNPTTAAIASLL
jgi:hypothetical protein